MDEEAFKLYSSVICAMDEGFLEWMAQEYKRNAAKKADGPRMSGTRR